MSKTSKTRCRFCPSEPMSATALRAHCITKHRKQFNTILASLPSVPQQEAPDYGAQAASLGREFRKRMGYNSRDGAAPEIPKEER